MKGIKEATGSDYQATGEICLWIIENGGEGQKEKDEKEGKDGMKERKKEGDYTRKE